MKVFQKTPSKFASKNKKMAKNRGVIFGNFYENVFESTINALF